MEQPDGSHGSVHLGEDRNIIVLALRAPNNPTTPKHKRRTFWTVCASCKEKNKHPIEYLSCNISCLHCGQSFTAVEVSRPRKKSTTTKNVQPGESSNLAPSSSPRKSPNGAPRRKKLRSGVNVTKGGNLGFSKDDITMLLKFKGKEILKERIKETMRAKNKPTPSATTNLVATPMLLSGASDDHYHGGDKFTEAEDFEVRADQSPDSK